MTPQETSFVFRALNFAEQLLKLRDDLENLKAEWDLNNFFNEITDADLLSIEALNYLTANKLSNAISAFTAVVTALGDNATGEATHLIKFRR